MSDALQISGYESRYQFNHPGMHGSLAVVTTHPQWPTPISSSVSLRANESNELWLAKLQNLSASVTTYANEQGYYTAGLREYAIGLLEVLACADPDAPIARVHRG